MKMERKEMNIKVYLNKISCHLEVTFIYSEMKKFKKKL